MYLGIDIGGTTTKLGLFPTLDTSQFTQVGHFPTQQDYTQQLQMLLHTIQHAPQHDAGHLQGVGVSIGGRMAQDGRSVLVAPNLPHYVGKPFAQDLTHAFRCPIRLAHDTVCGLLGEKKFGPIAHSDRCAYLTLSTGTGAAIQLRKGELALTVSIEIGHQLLDGNTLVCLCGQVGCLETYTGGRQLELRLGHTLAQMNDTAFWETFSDKLALGLINLSQLTRIETIAVSGAIVLHNPFLLPLVQHKIHRLIRGATLTLLLATLQEHAPLVGAVQLLATDEQTILH